MADVLPFIGTRYNSQLIGNLSKVLAPPYDVISPELQDELYERHPYNFVRLELAKEQTSDDGFSNKYTRAANTFHTWRSDGILIEDEKPSIYLYEQEFKLPNGETKKRRGFFAMVKLEDSGAGKISMHEETFAGPKADRLKLLHSTHANFSPIFVVYNDKEQAVLEVLGSRMKEKPWEEATDDDGVIHRLWVVQKKEFIASLRELMKDRRLFIADGHHRFETAINFRNEMRKDTKKCDGKQPFDYMMMYLTNAEQDGLVILPTHRVLTKSFMKEVDLKESMEEIRENFDIQDAKINLEKPEQAAATLHDKVEALGKDNPAFAMVMADGKVHYHKLKKRADPVELIDDEELHPEIKKLDVSVLHHYIINQVFVGNPEFELDDDECLYVRSIKQMVELLAKKKASLGFVLNATPMDQVIKIVRSGLRMPHKSTYFHPKIISGFVVRNMACEIKQLKSTKR